ncbi:uncharacterized protein FSUBG_11449 [Fusarium subglutinans]|uniref:Uncharacterized protein n=1 Tax=Gibberella subglutinans TaxID=42677 RepID=A0A8H5P3C6_GIBSU|nr:uncharacterized protein FSUBG_11449 [Fusarium subglutinans]KAF5588592.1 hypothetical protein FSUBG_11449 [Fusarium subglutinans]
MADTIKALPTPPPQSSKNKNEKRVLRAKERICAAAGFEPSELFGKHAPRSWGQSLIENLAQIIQLASSGKAGITVQQVVARIKEEASRDPTGLITNNIVNKVKAEIHAKSQECVLQDEEDGMEESDQDAPMTSSPSKDRPLKRRRKNLATEPKPPAAGTEDTGDDEGEQGSRAISSSIAEAKGPLPIEEYRKRIAAHQRRLELFKTDRDAAQSRIDQTDTLNNALRDATTIHHSARLSAQESEAALAELEALVANHGDILPASVRNSIPEAKQTLNEAKRKAEEAELVMTAAQKKVDDQTEQEPALQDTVVLMQEAVAGCVDDIDKEQKDMDAALCMLSMQRLSWEVLRAKPVEQVNDLRSLINDILASGE